MVPAGGGRGATRLLRLAAGKGIFPPATMFQQLPAPRRQLRAFSTGDAFWCITHNARFGGQAELFKGGSFPSAGVCPCKPVMVSSETHQTLNFYSVEGQKQAQVGQQMLCSRCEKVRAPQTLPCPHPSIPAQLFGEGSLKPLAEKNLVSSPRAPRVGCLMVGPCLPLSLCTPCTLSRRRAPTPAPGSPRGGYVPSAIAASCNCFNGLNRWSYFGLRLQGIFSRP